MPFPSGFLARSPRAPAPAKAKPATRSAAARRALLDRIAEFLEHHDLAASPNNLAVICGGLSGTNSELARAFVQRDVSGEPVDQRWLDTLARFDPDGLSRIAELETLMDKLEYALMRFAQTARSAQTETSDHRGAIRDQLNSLARPEELAEVFDLSRAMLARIEQAEAAMARSEAETERLRHSLAKARIEADVDHLTLLPNRRAFERRLISAATEARAKGEPLALAFCDVDHFKAVNDRHGHDAGDRVLCALAALFNEQAGDGCFVARHGGEEFVILFYGTDKWAGRLRLDSIRHAQAARLLLNRETGQPFGRITFSAGVADVSEDPDPRNALARADAALYRAKQEGRNRVIVG